MKLRGSKRSPDSGNFISVADDNRTFKESQTGKAFFPFGCNYYDARTGWPPKVWTLFNRASIRNDFRKMASLGVNAIRVWLQWSVFMPAIGKLSAKALDQLHELLHLAGESGIRVNLTGPELWEGYPRWLSPNEFQGYQHIVTDKYRMAHAIFWELLADHVADEPVIYGFDLANEPFMPWDGKFLRTLWNAWLKDRYGSTGTVRRAWGTSPPLHTRLGDIPPPPNRRIAGSNYLLDYQTFREITALRWIENTVAAIRRADQCHLITVGLHQSGCPLEEIVPSRYTAFNPHLLSECLDYIALHWYPFGNPLTASCQPFDLPWNMDRSLSIFLANCRYSSCGVPLVIEEFSYYGGGAPNFWGGVLPYRTVKEQDEFSRRLIDVGKRSVGGWLNWPLQDTRGATDTSEFGGFYTSSGTLKPWGRSFHRISRKVKTMALVRLPGAVVVPVERKALLTDWGFCEKILDQICKLQVRGKLWDFDIRK